MCGIAGYVDLDGHHPPSFDLMIAWAMLSTRGVDACGAMWHHEGSKNVATYRSARRSYDAALYAWYEMNRTKTPLRWVALHARAASVGKGKPDKLENNHPVQYGHIRVTHNGVIGNDGEVFKKLKAKRTADVDTQAIAACLNAGGLEAVLEHCQGSMSIAWADNREPDALHLYTNGQAPLWISSDKGKRFTYCSEPKVFPLSLHGKTAVNVPAGVHMTVKGGSIRETKVGVGDTTTKTYYVTPGLPAFPEGDYVCYNPRCSQHSQLHTHNKPMYLPDVHTTHTSYTTFKPVTRDLRTHGRIPHHVDCNCTTCKSKGITNYAAGYGY